MPLYATRDSYNYIGKMGVKRKDGMEKASGTGLYTRDVYLPGMLYGVPFISPYAHAKIKSLDTSAVEAYPGVRYVLRYDDPWWAEKKWVKSSPFWMWGGQYEDLIGKTANFAGEMMGFAVCADTEQICNEAIKLAVIDWDVLPFEYDGEKAIASGAPILEPDVNPDTNLRATLNGGFEGNEIIGDVEAGFAASDKVVEFKWSEEETNSSSPEAQVCVANFRGEYLEVWAHNQIPMRTQMGLARYFGSHIKIQLHSLYHGAQFGMANWLNAYRNFPIPCCIMAEKTRRPVKFLFNQGAFQHRSYEQGVHYMKVGFKNDGTIMACQDDAVVPVTEFNAKMVKGTSIQNYKGTSKLPYFNRPACVCYRHGMRSCGMMNMYYAKVAGVLGMDPAEVAIKNDGAKGHPISWVDENVKQKYGFPMKDSLKEVVQIGKQKFGWDSKYHAPGARILPNGKYHGVGFVHSIAWSPDPNMYLSYYQIAINIQRGDGHVRVIARHADHGWNHETAICQVVADEIGAKYDDVEFRPFDDTGFDTAAGEGSAGLVRTLPMTVEAARKVKRRILELCTSPGSDGATASPPLFPGLKPEDLDTAESMVFEKAKPENKKTFKDVANYRWQYYQPLIDWHGEERHLWDVYYMGRQCSFIEIEVDPDTGEITINNVVDVNDVGKCLNPEGVNAQQYGGSTMGLSHNRNEAMIYDPGTGIKLNDNLIDHKWFSFNDIKGPFNCNIVENGFGYAPYGVNGCSESLGATNSTLLCYAFFNATGKWVTEYPLTPDKVLRALGKI
jgi:xanthine dehydrogenase molybdenum-binding subunit